jgi:hypothetical protein
MPDHPPAAPSQRNPTPPSRTTRLRPLARNGAVALALATALVAALTATMLRPSASEAAAQQPTIQADVPVSDVTWTPGDDIAWEYLADKDQCLTTQSGTVTTSTPEQATQVIEALQQAGPKTDFAPETGILDTHVNVSDTANGPETGSTSVNMVIHAYITKERCEAAATQPGATPDSSSSAMNSANSTALSPATSSATSGEFRASEAGWALGGVVALFAATMFAAVTAVAATSIAATAAAAGVTVPTAAVALAAGCLGGATAGALANLLVQSYTQPGVDWKSTLASAAGGCMGGSIASLVPATEIAAGTAEFLNSAVGGSAPALVGTAGARAATSTGVELTGITEVVSTTTGALRAVR